MRYDVFYSLNSNGNEERCGHVTYVQDERNFTEEEEAKLRAVFGLEAKDLELVLETVSFFLEQVMDK